MAIKKSKVPDRKQPVPKEVTEATSAEIDGALEKLDPVLEVGDGIEIIEVPPEPQEPTPPTLTKEELHKLQLTQAQTRAANAEAALEMLRRDLLQKQIDPENKLARMGAFIRARTNEAAAAQAAYQETIKAIETRLGINLKEWAFNDENGQLSRVDL